MNDILTWGPVFWGFRVLFLIIIMASLAGFGVGALVLWRSGFFGKLLKQGPSAISELGVSAELFGQKLAMTMALDNERDKLIREIHQRLDQLEENQRALTDVVEEITGPDEEEPWKKDR